jgi:cobalt/nickel transport system permease protein
MIIDSVKAFEAPPLPSRLDAFDSRCRVLCALAAVIVLAAIRNIHGLAAGSILPVILLCLDGRSKATILSRALLNVNKIGIFIWIFLPLTYPGERLWEIFSYEGLNAALIITWKLNLMSVIILRMVMSMGIPGIGDSLGRLGFPLKLRMLLLLTMRYVLLLSDRMATMWRAVCVRSNDIRGAAACRVFACMVGTTLIHSADRAERASLAMEHRGGMAGFSLSSEGAWAFRDSVMCAIFLLNSAFILLFSRILPLNF